MFRTTHARAARCLLLGAIPFSAACDYPSEAPILDTRWAFPGEETSIEISELLPDGVTVAPGETGFFIETDLAVSEQTLGDLCPVCNAVDGQTLPKPSFRASFTEVVELPADVAAGALESGEALVAFTNGFSFDPLNPGPGPGSGSIQLTLHAGGVDGPVIGFERLEGGVDTFPPGSSLTVSITLLPETVTGITAVIEVDSPTGEPVRIDADEILLVEADSDGLLMSEAVIAVAGQTVTVESVDLDVGDVDDSFVERIQKGAIWLTVDNAFDVSVQMELVIAGGGITPITKSVTIPGGTSTQAVNFTGAELQSFFGVSGVKFSGVGSVGGAEPPLIATPSLRASIQADLDVTLRYGS